MRRLIRTAAATLVAGTLVAGCGSDVTETGARDVEIYAAASLQDVLEELMDAYQAEHPGVSLTASFDATSTLRAQIEQGAPADMLLAADTENPQALADGELGDEPVVFARNRVVLVVPADNPAGIRSWADLARAGTRIVAAGEAVPITRYAEATIDALAGRSDAPDAYADRVREAVVSREDNVRAVLTKVELGEADAAFVYVTDARASDGVTEVPLPDDAAAQATYAGTALRDGDVAVAGDFLAWLREREAQRILRSDGFLPPGHP